MRILSLFDGMACGYLAMQRAGVPVEAYHAYEIDKYAVKTAQHNFPQIEEHGDVFTADFTAYRGLVDFLVGGSPCTYWSIAQTKNRETEASGLGWELFSQYVRALHEAKPRYFIYENNKSMAKAIRDQIRATFGFEEICINSALVSAQNRQRLYWVGKRNEDGTYSKVNVQQPEDLGILLKDVLDGAARIPGYANSDKSRPIDAHYYKLETNGFEKRVWNPNPAKQQHDYVAVPINTTVDGKACTVRAHAGGTSVANLIGGTGHFSQTGVCEPVGTWAYAIPTERDDNGIPTKATSGADGKTYTVYPVEDGQITIKGKTYPIKLVDGYYIIRKLTVSECKRLQTVPEWYDFSCVSNSQAYKMLGNGWTVDVIAHLIKACLEDTHE